MLWSKRVTACHESVSTDRIRNTSISLRMSVRPEPVGGAVGVADRLRLLPWAAALLLPVAAFLLQGHIGLGFYDEGFMWYGAQRVLAGEVPLRDFQAYDVGRYYWSAAWMAVAGDDGIRPFRVGNALLVALTLATVVWLIRAAPGRSAALTTLATASIWLWMAPDFRAADFFAPVVLVAGLSRVLETPAAARRWGQFGICYGVAAAIGINHALYGCIGFILAVALLFAADRSVPAPRCWLALGAGLTAGYGPVLMMHAAVPGFSAAFIDSIRMLSEAGTTNLALPLPTREPLALLFVAAPAFWLVCATRLLRDRRGQCLRTRSGAVLAAGALMAVPYAHYALSRADVTHAVVSTLPLLVAAWTYPVETPRWSRIWVLVLVLGSAAFLPRQPAWVLLARHEMESVVVGSATLRVTPWVAADVRLVQRLVERHAPAGRTFYAAPYWPGAYAVASRRAPNWEIFALFPARPERQRRELARLIAADIGFAILSDWEVDRRVDLGLARTHPLLVDFVRRCLDPIPLPVSAPWLDHLSVFVPRRDPCD